MPIFCVNIIISCSALFVSFAFLPLLSNVKGNKWPYYSLVANYDDVHHQGSPYWTVKYLKTYEKSKCYRIPL